MKPFSGVFWALVFLAFARPALAAGPHYVFAHYMVCYSDYGQSIAGYEHDIQDAQAAGIDGFALDVGDYDDPAQTYYNTNIFLMYAAAEQLSNGFKLFFSVDMGDNTNAIVDMIHTYANRTNSFHYQGRLVVSSFCGNGGFGAQSGEESIEEFTKLEFVRHTAIRLSHQSLRRDPYWVLLADRVSESRTGIALQKWRYRKV